MEEVFHISRRTWRKENLRISYSNPIITPYNENDDVSSMKDVMYFYYNMTILHGKKTWFEFSTHDFPKVQELPFYIDEITSFNMDKAYLLEDYYYGDFLRQIRYHQVILEDSFQFGMEYTYKIERYDYRVVQSSETPAENWSEYVLTIGQMERSLKYGGMDRESYGKTLTIKDLTTEDMIRLKETAQAFCEETLLLHRKRHEVEIQKTGEKEEI